MQSKYFCFDTETGGLESSCSLLTLYGIVFGHDFEIIDHVDLKIKPDNGQYCITAEALSVNKIDILQHDKEAICKSEASVRFYDFCFRHGGFAKMIPVGHNVDFDISFVKTHLLSSGRPDSSSGAETWNRFFSHRKIDTAAIANYLQLAGIIPTNISAGLESLATHFGLSYEGAHNAKFDTMLTYKLLKLLVELSSKP